jgi:hypothetical protein
VSDENFPVAVRKTKDLSHGTETVLWNRTDFRRTRQSLLSPFLKELNTLGVLSGKVFFCDLGQFAEFLLGAELNENGAGLDEYRVSGGHVVYLNICK